MCVCVCACVCVCVCGVCVCVCVCVRAYICVCVCVYVCIYISTYIVYIYKCLVAEDTAIGSTSNASVIKVQKAFLIARHLAQIAQHLAYVSIRQHTSAYTNFLMGKKKARRTSFCVSIRTFVLVMQVK